MGFWSLEKGMPTITAYTLRGSILYWQTVQYLVVDCLSEAAEAAVRHEHLQVGVAEQVLLGQPRAHHHVATARFSNIHM